VVPRHLAINSSGVISGLCDLFACSHQAYLLCRRLYTKRHCAGLTDDGTAEWARKNLAKASAIPTERPGVTIRRRPPSPTNPWYRPAARTRRAWTRHPSIPSATTAALCRLPADIVPDFAKRRLLIRADERARCRRSAASESAADVVHFVAHQREFTRAVLAGSSRFTKNAAPPLNCGSLIT
jgi:hypothetical protein